MSPRRIQSALAAIFVGMGGVCMIAPAWIVGWAIQPAYHSTAPLIPILMACFGAQAVLVGVVIAASTFTRRSFAALGAALLPFFWFDWYFYSVVPLLTPLGLLDLAGNAAMLGLCWIGWRKSSV